jgi:hypothetical protein
MYEEDVLGELEGTQLSAAILALQPVQDPEEGLAILVRIEVVVLSTSRICP